MEIREIHKLIPIVAQYIMLAITHVVAGPGSLTYGYLYARRRKGRKAGMAVQSVHRPSMVGAQVLAFRIGPLVFGGTGHIDRPWSHERD